MICDCGKVCYCGEHCTGYATRPGVIIWLCAARKCQFRAYSRPIGHADGTKEDHDD